MVKVLPIKILILFVFIFIVLPPLLLPLWPYLHICYHTFVYNYIFDASKNLLLPFVSYRAPYFASNKVLLIYKCKNTGRWYNTGNWSKVLKDFPNSKHDWCQSLRQRRWLAASQVNCMCVHRFAVNHSHTEQEYQQPSDSQVYYVSHAVILCSGLS